ncbi:uncharacterized protein MELLADRAFT_104866 [Melampsora larici-populina 98AG31]|uniref:Uncharacterized protein n=1 Tax=Melampsora larici-populina (strain 98AG31 / pathotype 3-4-7) TaxID=747676 RepID=F4RG07_MELLP|nr:uncharacterized protein MELLADRAFT_104866 [Melampsora larici-populina 98AG31]EGG08467.1 hypothetical protein MELLADRAFT_104866 [Melampsora larici-populina 98AG31]
MGGRKGRSIGCPLGPSSKKRRQPEPQGSSQIIADLDASEARWVDQQSQRLNNRPVAPNTAMQHEQLQPSTSDQVEHAFEWDQISDINPEEEYLINHNIPDDPTEEPPEVTNFGDYVKGSSYKRKQIKEARNWAKVPSAPLNGG